MADRPDRVKRLFVAVDIDEPTRGQLATISSSLQYAVSGFSRTNGRTKITWVHSDRLHLTLDFFGEADAAMEQRLLSALAPPFPVAPFDLAFEGVGFFPPKGSPRVLWLGIVSGLAELHRLHATLRRRLGARDGSREDFNPHLTLARFRDRIPRPDVAALAEIGTFAGPCRIDRVTLYESRLSPKGPTYEALAHAALMS